MLRKYIHTLYLIQNVTQVLNVKTENAQGVVKSVHRLLLLTF